MTITDNSKKIGLTAESCGYILLREHSMTVSVNDAVPITIVCTPLMLSELAAGRLLTEGYISSAEEIQEISISDDGKNARIRICGSDETVPENAALRTPVRPIAWEKEWILALDDEFKKDTPLHRATRSTHSAFLSRRGNILCSVEDISRHNAVDKAIGHALLNDIPLGECILFTTGRMPQDMVRKAVMAGIPVLASRKLPTAEGLLLAKKYGVTLIGDVKNGDMTVFTNGGE